MLPLLENGLRSCEQMAMKWQELLCFSCFPSTKEGATEEEKNYKQLRILSLVLGVGWVGKLEKEQNSMEYLNNWIHDPNQFVDGGSHYQELHTYFHTNKLERCY